MVSIIMIISDKEYLSLSGQPSIVGPSVRDIVVNVNCLGIDCFLKCF